MEKLAQDQLDAYNEQNLESFCACYHPEVKMTRLISNFISVTNISEMKEVYRKLFELNPNLKCELKNRIVLPNAIVDEEFITGLQREPHGMHAVVIYGFRDGLIDRVWTLR